MLSRRCAEVDLSVCRLAGKASLALELLELPAMEFIDALARVKVCVESGPAQDIAPFTTVERLALDQLSCPILSQSQTLVVTSCP